MFLLPLLPLTGSPRTVSRLAYFPARLLLLAANLGPASKLNILGVLDHLFAFFQPHVRFLPIAAETLSAPPPAELAVKYCRAHVIHLHLKNALHRFLDFRLGCVLRHLKHHRVLRFLHAQTLLGNDGAPDNLINPVLHRLSLLPFGLGFGLRFFFRRRLLGRLFRFRSSSLHWSFRFRALLARCFLSSSGWSRLDLYGHFRPRRGKRPAELGHRFARQQHVLMPQQVVRLQRRRRDQRHAREVAAGAFQIHIRAAFHQQVRFSLFVQIPQHLAERLGLVRFQLPAIHHGQFLLRHFRRKRRAQRAQNHFLRQRVVVTARHRAVHGAAVPPQRRPDRADARAPCALLLPQFLARAGNFALVLRLVRSGALAPQMMPHSLVQQVRVHLRGKHIVGQFNLPDFFSFQVLYVHNRHRVVSLVYKFRLQMRLGLTNKNVTALRSRYCAAHQQQVLLGIHFHHPQILGSLALVPHVPGKMLPLPHTRGKRARSDPARRSVKHRSVARVAAAEMPALHAALKSLALAHAGDVHQLAHFKTFHQHAIPELHFILRIVQTNLLQITQRRHIRLLEMSSARLVHPLRLDEFHQAQLHRFVSVRSLRAPLHHHARPGLQDSARNCRAVVRENLRHPQLDSQYAVDCHLALSFLGFLSGSRL